MNQRLIHPDLMTSLYRFFNSTCDIQEPTLVPGEYGETQDKTWISTETDIDCVISRIKQGANGYEIRREDKTIVLHPYGIVLKGIYTITENNRILSGSDTYDIIAKDYDSKSSMTSLICERIEW